MVESLIKLASDELPEQCTHLSEHLQQGDQYIFDYSSALPWSLIILYMIVFGVPIGYIYHNRQRPSFMTRSPMLIMVSFFLMMCDCILNTNLISHTPGDMTPTYFQCDLEIVITVVVFFGILMIYYARMWRVYKVFSLYQDYMDQQKLTIEKEIESD